MRYKITKSTIVIASICYVIFITALSLIKISNDTLQIDILYLDKIVHFCFYFGLNTLLLIMAHLYFKQTKVWKIIGITYITALYGFAIEIIQHYVGREFDVGDIIANTVGAIIGLMLYYFIRPYIFKVIR